MTDKKSKLPESGLVVITESIHNVSIEDGSISDDNDDFSFGTAENVIDGRKCDHCQLMIPYLFLNEHGEVCLLAQDKYAKRRTEVC